MPKPKPARADVCIVGVGASGGTAAYALTQRGARVVGLNRGAWLKPEDLGADELASVNRYHLWPDPLLSPRTYRSTDDEEATPTQFSQTPHVVGGGTTHWTGWVPRMVHSDFREHSLHGDVDGASLADWPIAYEDLEPYYSQVEWTLGVSGRAGANVHEAPRSRGYPVPPLPESRYARKFVAGCERLGLSWFPTPTAMLSEPYDGRPATHQSAFVQQHGDPTGTKSTVATTFVPRALATGRFDLRPHCYVTELRVDASGKVLAAVYLDEDGDLIEQEADVFLLSCGAIESARLLLMSTSGAFPEGLANGSGLVGRNLTLHEYTAAIGSFDDEEVFGWAGGGYISASTFDFYEHDPDRPFLNGCHIAGTGVGVPLPINFSVPGKPLWGAAAKEADRRQFNRSMGVGVVVHDLPQECNRVDLDPDVRDAWGLPVARITHRAHPNDLVQANWMVDRCAEILEAAGASQVTPVHIDRITGNASHQHGTARMGRDPATSVLDASCRAHEVPNLYAIDGSSFPTASGLNSTLTIMANAWRVADAVADGR
jgi:choline dehydrogenase-like flavoprotein